MAAATQTGETLKIGFPSGAYTGYVFDDGSAEATGENEIIKDENGATLTVITMDAGVAENYTFIIKDAGSLVPPALDSTITLTSPSSGGSVLFRCTSSQVQFARGAARLQLGLIKEVSMTYS